MSSQHTRSTRRLWVFGCVVGVITIIFSSCPQPIDVAILNRVKDGIGPVIVITSPSDGDYCANVVQVDGTVTDSATAGEGDGGITALAYEVLGTATAGGVEVAPDGAFSFQISTSSFGESFTLVVTATDWNGNQNTASLSLRREQGSGLPSFTAAAGNRTVTLQWDPVPNTLSYTLRYTTNGALPSETVGSELTDVTSPLELSVLENGNLHVFQLFANAAAPWPDSESAYVQAVPLSERTLSPRVTGEVSAIRVEWAPVPAEETYEVWRSTSIDGSYVNLSGPVRGTEYLDTDVDANSWYYYKVRPANFDNGLSAAGAAQRSPVTLHAPVLVTTFELNDLGPDFASGHRVKIAGDYAYVADVDAGLQIIDINDPENAVHVGGVVTPGSAFDVVAIGDYAYVADLDAGLTVVNVSDKLHPVVEASIDVDYMAVAIAASATHLYVTDVDYEDDGGEYSQIQVFDLSTPAAPGKVGTPVTIPALAVAVSGDMLYAACKGDEPSDFVIYSLTSDPTAPAYLGETGNPDTVQGFTWGMAIQGDYAYLPDRDFGLKIVDVSVPTGPAFVSSCLTDGRAYDVVVDGPYAYVAAESSGLQIIDIADPPSVTDESLIASRSIHAWGGGLGVDRKGEYIYLAEWYHGLSVLRVTTPTQPAVVGTLTGLDAPLGVAVQDSQAYVADYESGLRVVDVASPGFPQLSTTLSLVDDSDDPTGGVHAAAGLALSGNRAYIAEKLKTVDISNPGTPQLLGSVYTNGFSINVDAFGPFAYQANLDIGLHLVDISADGDPVITSLTDTTGSVFEAVARGSYVFAVDGLNGFRVFDATDPSQLTTAATVPLNGSGGQAIALAIEGETAVVLEIDGDPYVDPVFMSTPPNWAQLHVIDVSNPESPVVHDLDGGIPGVQGLDLSSPTPGAQAVELRQGYAYIVDNDAVDGRLDVIDVSRPDAPFKAGSVSIPGAVGLALSGRYAYVTTMDGTFRIVDLIPDL